MEPGLTAEDINFINRAYRDPDVYARRAALSRGTPMPVTPIPLDVGKQPAVSSFLLGPEDPRLRIGGVPGMSTALTVAGRAALALRQGALSVRIPAGMTAAGGGLSQAGRIGLVAAGGAAAYGLADVVSPDWGLFQAGDNPYIPRGGGGSGSYYPPGAMTLEVGMPSPKGVITKVWQTETRRRDGSTAVTQFAMTSNGLMMSLSASGKFRSWRPYRSIVIGKQLTTSNVKRVARRIKSHVKGLKTVLRDLK